MFNPITERIASLAKKSPARIEEISKIFDRETIIYIDFGNVIKWQERLTWHISLKRIKQLLDSFDTIKDVRFYYGTLDGSVYSRDIMREVKRCHYNINTKPVKEIKLSVDVSSIPIDSPEIIKQFISPTLFRKLDFETIKYLNLKLKEMNQKGIRSLIKHKCNFDVEIGVDMRLDDIDSYILWSGDSDFADPLHTLLANGKKAGVFSMGGKVSTELNELKKDGLFIFDIKKIKNFICWRREIEA